MLGDQRNVSYSGIVAWDHCPERAGRDNGPILRGTYFLPLVLVSKSAMIGVVLFVVVVVSGCASLPSAPTPFNTADQYGQSPVQIEHGRPNRVLDGIGWVAGIPNKVSLWDRRADNHDIAPATEERLIQYMVENDLSDVLVRVNQYDPIGEWQRLTRNKRVAAGWRYTVGTLNMLEYTLLPGRILGGDWYNPYTDTINLYSDIPALALSEAAYAKDVHHRESPGTYAAVQEVPVVGMWHETVATRDVLEYVQARGTEPQQQEAYRILYPDYGASWGGQVASFIPYGHLFGRLAGAAVGHTANGVRTLVSSPEEPSEAPMGYAPTADSNWAQQTPMNAMQPYPPREAERYDQASSSDILVRY